MSKQTHDIPTLRKVIEGALGAQLPTFPGTSFGVKNLDKVCAALLDIPPAHVERTAANIGMPDQSEKLSSVFADAVGRQLRGASIDKITTVVDGMVADYLEKRNRRTRVLEIAAQEITRSLPSAMTYPTSSTTMSNATVAYKRAVDVLKHGIDIASRDRGSNEASAGKSSAV
jgi:hypothetical protein